MLMKEKIPARVSLLLHPKQPPRIVGDEDMCLLFLVKKRDEFAGLAIPENNRALLSAADWREAGLKIVEGPPENMRMADPFLAKKIGEEGWMVNGKNTYICRTADGYFCNSRLLDRADIIVDSL
jgi:hypothetical protein